MPSPDLINFTTTQVYNPAAGRHRLGIDLDAINVSIAEANAAAAAAQATANAALTAARVPGPPGPQGPAGPLVFGTATINFGAFPGATEASVTVSDARVHANSLLLAWPLIAATADHTATDLYLEEFTAIVASVGTGTFTLLARPRVGKAYLTYTFCYIRL